MSQENLEIVRRIYEALNRRTFAGSEALIPADFEWVPDGRSFESPIRGRERVFRFLEDQIETLDVRVQPEEFFEKDDKVVAFVRTSGRGAASGAEFDISIAAVWTFQDGVPVRAQAYAERGEALEAVELRE